jgi:methionyl aminopeptidase
MNNKNTIKLEKSTLVNAIKAANIHKKVGNDIRQIIKPGMTLNNISTIIENKINEETNYNNNYPLDGGIGFPIGLSVNNCVAHYTPNYKDIDIILNETDIIKIDYGVHIKGTIIDSAFTINFDNKYDEFVNISRNLTNYAVSLCGPDVILGELGGDIEEYIKSKEIIIDNKTYQLKIMRDLSGHMIRQYDIHAGVAVPNIAIDYKIRMKEYEYYAIEPFITTGNGISILKTPTSHYMFSKNYKNFSSLNKEEKNLYNIINNNYSTLPFCQKWLYNSNNFSINYNDLLFSLEKKNIINSYPPIYDINNSIVSQFEHTIFVKENGIINLTKNDYY